MREETREQHRIYICRCYDIILAKRKKNATCYHQSRQRRGLPVGSKNNGRARIEPEKQMRREAVTTGHGSWMHEPGEGDGK